MRKCVGVSVVAVDVGPCLSRWLIISSQEAGCSNSDPRIVVLSGGTGLLVGHLCRG